MNIKIEMAAIERGQAGDLFCKVEQLRPFEGEAVVQLIGLPAHTSTESRKITKDTKELIFPIQSTKDAQARTSKTATCSGSPPAAAANCASTTRPSPERTHRPRPRPSRSPQKKRCPSPSRKNH